jgi:hypothetical protein
MKRIESEMINNFNEACKSGLNLSYLSILNIEHDAALKMKKYNRAYVINNLINEEINN